MVNKSLLPVRFRLPVLGEYVFYTRGLKYNFELIFFWGPGEFMPTVIVPCLFFIIYIKKLPLFYLYSGVK